MATPLYRPTVAALIFQLYARPLHPELFEVVAERSIRHPDFHLFVRATRTGHVISWDDGRTYLTEVTAPADLELPQRGRLLHHPFRTEQSTGRDCGHGIRYQATFQVETMHPEVFAHVHDEILADGGKRGLLFNFAGSSRLPLAPLAHLTAEFRPGCLFLTAFHTFPGEHTILKTQSLIERTK